MRRAPMLVRGSLALALGCVHDPGSAGEPAETDGGLRSGRCRAGEASSQFVAQTALPETVAPTTRLPVRVSFVNCSGLPWSPTDTALVPLDPDEGAAWGVLRVPLPERVEDGAEVTLGFELVAPSDSGRYPARWAIARERDGIFQEPTPTQAVQVLAPADCALPGPPIRFRGQEPPPAFVGTGARVRGRVTFANCSPETLSAAGGWQVASRAEPAGTWGPSTIALPADVPYGAEVSVELAGIAPSAPGRYRWSWQLAQNGTGTGERSPLVEPVVLSPADCTGVNGRARFLRQVTPPGTVDPHQAFEASATFANCGTTVWDRSYRLDTALPAEARPWTAGPVALPLPVGPGFSLDVPFGVRAPGTPGRYPYRFGIVGPNGVLNEPGAAVDITVRCIPQCAGRTCGGDGCGGACGTCPGGWSCEGARCQPPERPQCDALQWWNTYLTYAHISGAWYDTDLGVRANTPVQLRHSSRLDRTGVYAWGYMPEFTDLATGHRFRLLHLRPQHPYATEVGRTYPAGTIVGISGGDTRDTGLPTYSTGAHLCVQTLSPYRTVFPAGTDACR